MLRKFLSSLILLTSLSSMLFGNSQSETAMDNKENGKVLITVLDGQAYALERYDELLKTYQESHPNIIFEVQHAANDFSTIRSSRINSGQIPDIIVGQSGSDVSRLYDYAYDFTNDPILEKFTKSALSSSINDDGKYLSLPWVHENMSLIYNKDLFEQAGITTLPKTLDELEDVAKILDAAGITPFGVAFKEPWVIKHVISHFVALTNENPKETISALSNENITFEELTGIENSFRMIDLMIKYGVSKPLETGWEKSENMLANGEVAMIHMGDWAEAVLKKFNPNINMGFIPMPVSNDPKDAVILSNVSWQYVINKDSAHLDETKAFLEYLLTSDDGLDWMGNGLGSVPPTVNAKETSGILSNNALEYISAGESKAWNHVLYPSGFGDYLSSDYQEYILGTLTPEEVLTNLSDEWLYTAE